MQNLPEHLDKALLVSSEYFENFQGNKITRISSCGFYSMHALELVWTGCLNTDAASSYLSVLSYLQILF